MDMRAKKSTILIAVAGLWLGASAAHAQTEVILFKLTSQAAVYNNPSQKTMFRLDRPAFITKMFTYHWNNGWGAGAGQIGLRNAATGQMVGMWKALGTQHMFDLTPGAAWPSRGDGPPMLHWAVQPNVEVPPGTYEIVDSNPGTWASNAEMGNRGCAWVFGVYGGGGGGQITPSPGATPQVQPTPPPSTAGGVYTLTTVTPDSHNAAPGKYPGKDPGFGSEVLSCSSGRAEMRWWSKSGAGPGEFQARWEWNVPAQLVPGQVWPVTGTVTVVNNHNIWPAKREEISTGNYFWPTSPGSGGPAVTSDNPAGYRATMRAVGKVSPAKADFDMNMSNDEGCMFWYHYKWNPGGAITQVVPSPVATPQVNPQPTYGGMATANVAGNWTSSDDSFGSLAVTQSGSNVNMHYPKRSGRVIGQLRGNIFDGYWIQDFSGRRCSNSRDSSSFWGRIILTFNGDSYTGNWGYCDEAPGVRLQGNRSGGGYGQIVPSPAATPQVQPMPAGALNVNINPPQQTINSGEKAVTTANVTGGTPPYTYAWYNGTRQSQVVRGGVNWTMKGAGTRDIKVIVTDSAGRTAEAHAQIFVQEGGGGQVMPSPPATPQVQPVPSPSTAGGVYTLTTVTPDSHNAAAGKYPGKDPGFGSEVLSCSSGRAEMRWWSKSGAGPGEFQVRWEWNVPSQLLPGQVWPITGTVTVVENHNIWPAKREEISTGNYFWPTSPGSGGPAVTSDNPAGYRATMRAVGKVSTAKADFDLNLANDEGCMFWYHYKWIPGGAYTQVVPSPMATPEIRPVAQQGMLSVRITPTEQIVKSGDKAVTTADATGGTPPYSYAWYNGAKQSQVTRGSVTWTMGAAAGARDIRVVVTDSAGGTAEAHAQIVVR
jgi:hypothetical protein